MVIFQALQLFPWLISKQECELFKEGETKVQFNRIASAVVTQPFPQLSSTTMLYLQCFQCFQQQKLSKIFSFDSTI